MSLETSDDWLGNGGDGSVASLLGGVASEARARSVYGGGQPCGEDGGGLVEDSSFRCPRGLEEAVRRRALAWRLESLTSAWQ